MARTSQPHRTLRHQKDHTQNDPTHLITQNTIPIADACPDSDGEEDSFDVTSLVPSASNSMSQSGFAGGYASERTGASDTFLHTNQDHTRHLRQLQKLIPSPATVSAHPERVSQCANDSSAFENSSAINSRRMRIPRVGVPVTLFEETSQELRLSDLSNHLNPTGHNSQGSSDEDGCTTMYAPRGSPYQTSYSVKSDEPSNGYEAAPSIDERQSEQDTKLEASNERSHIAPQDYRTTQENRRHALAESIGLNTTTLSQAGPSSIARHSHANHVGTENQRSTNGRFHQPADNMTPATNHSQSRLSSISSYFNSAKKYLSSTMGPAQSNSLDYGDEDTPPTSFFGNQSESEDGHKDEARKGTMTAPSRTASEALQTYCSHEELSRLSRNRDGSCYDSGEIGALSDVDRTPTAYSRPSALAFNKTPSFLNFNFCEPPDQSQAFSSKGPATMTSQVNGQLPRRSLCSTSYTRSEFESQPSAQIQSIPAVTPFQRPVTTNAAWMTSVVKTPSKLQISYVPTSPSSTPSPNQSGNLSIGTTNQERLESRVIDHSSPSFHKSARSGFIYSNSSTGERTLMATPQHVKRKREFEKTFLNSPLPSRDSDGKAAASTSGEARIFHQSQQTTSILHGMNGQSWSHLQDQSLPQFAPNQSFGLEFSLPIEIKDWSIHHSPPPACQDDNHSPSHDVDAVISRSCGADAEVSSMKQNSSAEQTSTAVDAKQSELTQMSRFPTKTTSTTGDGSLFGPHASQLAPLPHFSPLRLPEPRPNPSGSQAPMFPISKREDSPLTARTKRRDMDAGQVNVLSRSILRPRSSGQPQDPTWLQYSESGQQDNVLPNWLLFNRTRGLVDKAGPNSPLVTRLKPPLSDMVDDSVYMTPDTSLMADNHEHIIDTETKAQTLDLGGHLIDQDIDDEKSYSRIVPGQDDLPLAWEANIFSRYRILVSLAENFQKDLSIKNQVIQVLKTDRDQACRNRDETEQKMKEMTESLQEAVLQQKSNQDQHAQRIASIVENLTSEIDSMMVKCETNSAEEKKGVSADDVHQFQTQLQSSKAAMEQIQELPADYKSSIAELELCNFQQAEKIAADQKEIAMLRQQIDRLQGQATSGTLAATETITAGRLSPARRDGKANGSTQLSNAPGAQGQELSETPRREAKAVDEREALRMKIEIESLSKQLAIVSVKDQDLKHVKENVRMLEEEAKARMEALAEFRTESLNLQHELKITKKALKLAEDEQAEASERINQLQHQLDSVNQEKLFESQANLAKLTESRNGFNADLSELMAKLKASNQETEQLQIEVERLKSDTCKDCQSKEIQSIVLQEERNTLQRNLDECKAQSADREVQLVRLRKARQDLRDDIEGLNIALQAKQQENSYLKRDRHVRETGLTSSSLATSTKTTSNRTSIRLASRTTTEGSLDPAEEKSTHPTARLVTHNPRKPTSENRAMLSSIGNRSNKSIRPSSSESVTIIPSDQTLRKTPFLDRKTSSVGLSRRSNFMSQQNEEESLPANHQHESIHAGKNEIHPKVRRTPSSIIPKHNSHTNPQSNPLKHSSNRTNQTLSRTSSFVRSSSTLVGSEQKM
ncbi:hypothetical protein MJO28_009668 [Puccinia striiformis f. sp. tritici]|uniref:Uncharacterized protein n=1 Tax=Puccinia striiformis f. sp. tritici TaxID=168172 RepID=A0ACC0E7Q0_9BASI|nr:hypothetical protein MJO28_009668 [Puccinia striiformis f. sp. tritici]